MRKISKSIIALTAFVVAASLVGHVWALTLYETVGGEIAPINFITTFLVPAIVVIAIFGALIVLGVIRIRSDANKSK